MKIFFKNFMKEIPENFFFHKCKFKTLCFQNFFHEIHIFHAEIHIFHAEIHVNYEKNHNFHMKFVKIKKFSRFS